MAHTSPSTIGIRLEPSGIFYRVWDCFNAEDYRQQVQQHVATVQALADTDHPDPDAFQQALDKMDKSSVKLAEVAITKTLKEEGQGELK